MSCKTRASILVADRHLSQWLGNVGWEKEGDSPIRLKTIVVYEISLNMIVGRQGSNSSLHGSNDGLSSNATG